MIVCFLANRRTYTQVFEECLPVIKTVCTVPQTHGQNVPDRELATVSFNWISYTSGTNTYYVLNTLYNGTTTEVTSFSGPKGNLDLAVGEDKFYSMDRKEKEIGYYNKRTNESVGSIASEKAASQIIKVEGKCVSERDHRP